MNRWIALAAGILAALGASVHTQNAPSADVTFHRDVLPILQKRCQPCHRPGEIAPMSFLTYDSTRPWARAIKAAVTMKKMPPWFADADYGHFANDRSLAPAEVDTLVRWVDGGAVAGDPTQAPPAVSWPDGWQIQPGYVVEAPAYTIPASGTIEWGYITVPGGFAKDTWVTSIEVRPQHREAVHHIVIYIKQHSPDVPYGVPLWDQKQRDAKGAAVPGQGFLSAMAVDDAGRTVSLDSILGPGGIEAIYVPAVPPNDYRVHRAAKLIPAGSDLVFQVHYTPVGKPVSEVTRIGFTIATDEPTRRFVTYSAQPPSIADPKVFRIPPGEANWQSPPVEGTFNVDAELVWMMPHMHLRGKDMRYTLQYPDGRSEVALSVSRYDFKWQIGYDVAQAIKVSKGTKLRVDAHFDNSAANKANPDPAAVVYGGTQSWDEMMNPFFGVVVDRAIDPKKIMSLGAGPAGSGGH